MKSIDIASDFSKYPGGRYAADGDGNGESFRQRFLVPVLESGQTARVVLDGARGYPSSFLEEAFGGLIRQGYEASKVKSSFQVVASEPGFERFVTLVDEFIDQAAASAKETS